MKKLIIVFHSAFGHTEKVAVHIRNGALSGPNIDCQMLSVDQALQNLDVLDLADGLVFGCPTYMGNVSAPFKTFMDATSRKWLNQTWRDKYSAGFTNSGSLSGDKFNTLVQLTTFAAQHGMIWIGNAGGFCTPSKLEPTRMLDRFGSCLGLMTQSDNAPVNVTPPQIDLESAEFFGSRVAYVVAHSVDRNL